MKIQNINIKKWGRLDYHLSVIQIQNRTNVFIGKIVKIINYPYYKYI